MNYKFTVRLLGLVAAIIWCLNPNASAVGPAQKAVDNASAQKQVCFVMFYRQKDAATDKMYNTLQDSLANRQDAVVVPVIVSSKDDKEFVEVYDAARIPLPAVIALAPNGAICSAYPKQVTAQQIDKSFPSPVQAECLKALQDNQIVLLCVQPVGAKAVPQAATEFSREPMYSKRTKIVTVTSENQDEVGFLQQLKVPGDGVRAYIAFMAPPGSVLGVFDDSVTFDQLAQKIAATGKCCEDENCKFNKAASKAGPTKR